MALVKETAGGFWDKMVAGLPDVMPATSGSE